MNKRTQWRVNYWSVVNLFFACGLVNLLVLLPASITLQKVDGAQARTDASCQLTWNLVPDPHSVGASAIAAVSSNDIWISSDSILHWDGTEWSSVYPLINRAIVDFAVVSSTDIWGAGWTLENSYYHSLVMHWDGVSWSDVNVPDIGNLRGIAATAPNSIWVVGNLNREIPTSLRWNGIEWETIPMPYSDWRIREASVGNISALSETDIWAVGGFEGQSSSLSDVMIWHWDGTQWNYMPTSMGWFSYFNAVYAISANDVWAVGNSVRDDTLIAHWDGIQWYSVPDNHKGTLVDIFALSANDVWAVGGYELDNSSQLLLEQWNGTAWNVVNLPKRDGYVNGLARVAAISDVDVWAVGTETWHGALPCITAKPAKPILVLPLDQSGVSEARARLRWKPASNANWYEVIVKKGEKVIDKQLNLTNTRYVTKALKRNNLYKWRVRACNSVGCRSSAWWEFFVPK